MGQHCSSTHDGSSVYIFFLNFHSKLSLYVIFYLEEYFFTGLDLTAFPSDLLLIISL
jgi:hypothetical protein